MADQLTNNNEWDQFVQDLSEKLSQWESIIAYEPVESVSPRDIDELYHDHDQLLIIGLSGRNDDE